MKRDTTILLALALLLNSTAPVWAQEDDLSEDDLKTLLDNSPTASEELSDNDPVVTPKTPVTEADTEVSQPAPVAESTPAPTPAPVEEVPATPPAATEPLSSETVDLEDIEDLEQIPDAPKTPPVKAAEAPAKTPLDSELESLEPLNDDLETAKNTETFDDLDSLKTDMGDEGEFKPAPATPAPVETAKKDAAAGAEVAKAPEAQPGVFDVGREERDLLSIAQTIQGQISDNEWNEVATAAKVSSYTVVQNDWLFKISKRLFGSGFFYPKIWSLNSYITNPHFIEPGMILSFTTGSGSNAPQVKLGAFSDDELNSTPGSIGNTNPDDLANFGEDAKPKWIDEKNDLKEQGVYFQYASDETMEDLIKAGEEALNREYESYEPPPSEFDIVLPKNYDKSGFDKSSRIFYSFKEGFYLSTFVSTNIVQDFGSIVNGADENIFFGLKDHAYVKFDSSINAVPGDKFSVYTTMGKAQHASSDREGYKYAINAQIKLIRKIQDKWEVEFIELAGTPQRGDRITVYTPKIERITRTYNSRLIEAGIIASFKDIQTLLSFGDVIYLDRGRADGLEMGNVLEVFGFKDRLLKENITDQPTYKMGELTVITLTDNFATVIVSNSIKDFSVGDIAITKTKEAILREQKARDASSRSKKELMGGKALEELDVELNLENLNDDLLKQADKIQLTEDELAELERQEREKSVIKDSERDLKSLERLENEIEQAETILNDAKLDEDKLLENENLNDIEKKRGAIDQESLDEIEENLGKRYIDEDLNSKDNPFGLSEFDVEEVDELLNVEKGGAKAPVKKVDD